MGRFAGVEHANPIIPRLSRAETRATEYSKAATKGNWQHGSSGSSGDTILIRLRSRATADARRDISDAAAS